MNQQHRLHRRPIFWLGAAVAITLIANTAAAEPLPDPTDEMIPSMDCDDPTCLDAAEAVAEHEYARAGELFSTHVEEAADDEEVDGAWLVYAAHSFEQAESWDDAASLYRRAAGKLEPLHDYLLTLAVRNSLEGSADEELLKEAMRTKALQAGYEEGNLLLARTQQLLGEEPQPEVVERAFEAISDYDEACGWLVDLLDDHSGPDQALFDVAWGHCIDDDETSRLQRMDNTPSASARLARGERFAAEVDFEPAVAELGRIDTDDLSDTERCRRDFRKARSNFRLRRHTAAGELYRRIVEHCDDDATEDQRVRSLYALGNRAYQRGRLDESQEFFEKLYRDYPERSHADDALFFLARVERRRDEPDRQREIDLLVEALENYPHEDMVHEMAWEVYEPTFRDGDYRGFIDAITSLPLPDRDLEYFSQGRLEYFVGLAHQRLDELDDAARYWQRAWVKYPFSFYGYLAHLRLLEHDFTPERLQPDDPVVELGWFDEEFDDSPTAILARAGHLDGACNYERARVDLADSDRHDRWRIATLCHQAGQFPVSHDIARRQISGRPWSLPADGRLARWHVAWPDPYAAELSDAIDEFGADGDNYVHPALASSIMREESAFHEEIVSWAGAIGLMQLMPGTAVMHDDVIEGDAEPERLKRAEINIPVGIDHLAHLSNSLDGHPVMIVAAYNAGIGRIESWLRRQPDDEIALWVEDIPILQTRDYTKRVIGSYAAYQILQGEHQLDDRVANPAR